MTRSVRAGDVVAGLGFVTRLGSFLRRPVSVSEAHATLRERLATREAAFLEVAGAFFATSPYRELLREAGCEGGDLARLVATDGVEGALRTLQRHGVYLSLDEFRGRRPVIRGRTVVPFDPARVASARSWNMVLAQSGGSRGAGTVVGFDFAFIRDTAVDKCLNFHARGGAAWAHALWGVPGSFPVVVLLTYAAFGVRPVRWFSQIAPDAPGLHLRYRWSARALRWGSLLAGRPLPAPEHVPTDAPLPIARWMAGELEHGRTPHLYTFASSAVRLARAALAAGIDLVGAELTVGSEPVTAARLDTIRRTGAQVRPSYGSAECSRIGYACLAPKAPDDVHLLHDLHAVIQPAAPSGGTGLPPDTLLFSSLRPTAPLLLLNVSIGDQAVLRPRACGCPLEPLGWTLHLHTIRSQEKLTVAGMTLPGRDVLRVLEEALPARFGGGPTDYQLVESGGPDGEPRLRLLVSPAVGRPCLREVLGAFLDALGAGSDAARVVALQWKQSGVLTVERQVPVATPVGKILALHSDRQGVSP